MALPYFPIEEGDFKLTMGLKPAAIASWIEVDGDYDHQMRIRRSLLRDQRTAVFANTDGAAEAERQVYQMVQENILARHPNIPIAAQLEDGNDLVKAASLVQEDLVIMREGESGFDLVSAAVCFPSAWDLAAKVGRNMHHIHAPVPGVNETIGKSIDLFFKNMKPEKLVERFNWGLYDRENLFQPNWWRQDQTPMNIDAQLIGEALFFRVERQTLQRIGHSKDALFTIRIFNTSLAEVAQNPERAARLSHHIATMDQDFKSYKSIARYEDLIQDYLKRRF
jgi:hypothetical protein